MNSGKIEFIVGDMKAAGFGVGGADLERLRGEVTLVIHTAASTAFNTGVREAIDENCLPALELAGIAGRFRRLKQFIQISTAYVNSFLPDGHVGEKMYSVSEEDPEDELAGILETGGSPHAEKFASGYAHAKYLTERLLRKRYPLLPLLLLRPTIFGAALRDPYPVYGPEASTPMTRFSRLYFSDRGGKQVWHTTAGYKSGANVLDEVPVDFVANACLLHAVARTLGVVHVGSQLYVQLTFDEFLQFGNDNAPLDVRKELPEIIWTENRSEPQSVIAEVVKVGTRDWHFDCGRSFWMKQVGGPLNLQACRHGVDRLNAARIQEIFQRRRQKLAKL